MSCNSTEGRNRTHIDGFGDRSPTIGGLPFVELAAVPPLKSANPLRLADLLEECWIISPESW